MELIYIPKEYFNSDSDEVFYLSKHEVYTVSMNKLALSIKMIKE